MAYELILVVGKTGAGKSTFISQATGQDAGVGHNFQSETTQVGSYPLPDGSAYLVDTPGFGDTRRPPVPDSEILREIAEHFRDCQAAGWKITGFVWVISMQERLYDNGLMEKIIGEDNMRRCVIVTSKWMDRRLMPDEYRNQESGEKNLFEILAGHHELGAQYARFDKNRQSALDTIRRLKRSRGEAFTPLLMQQYCNEGKQLIETDAGRILDDDVGGRIASKRSALERTAADYERCRHTDPTKADRLEKKLRELKKELEGLIQEQEKLNEQKDKMGKMEKQLELQRLQLEKERMEREKERLEREIEREESRRALELEKNKGLRKLAKRVVGVGGIIATAASGGTLAPISALAYGATAAAAKTQKSCE